MTDRVTLKSTVFMTLDGQPQLVYSGTVFDTADGTRFGNHTVAAGGGSTLVNNTHTSVSKRKGPGDN